MSYNITRVLRGSLKTSQGPGGAGSIGHYVQPCRKIILTYCSESVASKGVREWIVGHHGMPGGAVELAQKWPQVEWVIREGKRGTEPHLLAHYVNSKTKVIGLHMFNPSGVRDKVQLLLSSTGRKLSGPGAPQGFNNYKKRPVETNRLQEPVRGHWSGFGPGSSHQQ